MRSVPSQAGSARTDVALIFRELREAGVQRLQERLVAIEDFRASRHEFGIGVARRRLGEFDRARNVGGRDRNRQLGVAEVGRPFAIEQRPGRGIALTSRGEE
jgi:hypothetical protein